MKIGYLDLQINRPREKYYLNADGYGGGSCFAKHAKYLLNNKDTSFYIFGSKENFLKVTEDEGKEFCIELSDEKFNYVRNGGRLKDILPDYNTFDIIVHHHDVQFINMDGMRAKLVHWALMGDGRANHPNTPYTLLYNPGETANYGKSYPIRIGTFVPSVFVPSKIEDHIFQCSRHDGHQNTIEVAQLCLANNIKGYFAGPILDNYPLMNFIDNKITFYLGLIDEEEKIKYSKSAVLTTYLHRWETAFNLSVISSLAYGTPIFANHVGCFKYLLQDGINGFINNGRSFTEIYELARNIDRKQVWETALGYSHTAMVNSFYQAFEQIMKD